MRSSRTLLLKDRWTAFSIDLKPASVNFLQLDQVCLKLIRAGKICKSAWRSNWEKMWLQNLKVKYNKMSPALALFNSQHCIKKNNDNFSCSCEF